MSLLTSYFRFKGFGTFEDVTVLNSPAQAVSVGTTGGAAIIQSVTVDNCKLTCVALSFNNYHQQLRAMLVPLATTPTGSILARHPSQCPNVSSKTKTIALLLTPAVRLLLKT
jgi:hypothetical protein